MNNAEQILEVLMNKNDQVISAFIAGYAMATNNNWKVESNNVFYIVEEGLVNYCVIKKTKDTTKNIKEIYLLTNLNGIKIIEKTTFFKYLEDTGYDIKEIKTKNKEIYLGTKEISVINDENDEFLSMKDVPIT